MLFVASLNQARHSDDQREEESYLRSKGTAAKILRSAQNDDSKEFMHLIEDISVRQ